MRGIVQIYDETSNDRVTSNDKDIRMTLTIELHDKSNLTSYRERTKNVYKHRV